MRAMAEGRNTTSARERIRATGERLTLPRLRVLETLLRNGGARTHQEIEGELGAPRMDRVTVYRVLEWLVAKGLAHRIAGSDRVWRFSIAGAAEESHAHFVCNRCGKVLCLDEAPANKMKLQVPDGCRPKRIELMVTGLCSECP